MAAPEILLTFDDGPAIDKTPKVLDPLDQHGIKAVFFVLGNHFQGTSAVAEKSRELVREELRRGHAVGNHTIHHYFLCGHFYIKQAWQEIEGNAKLIEDAIGQRPDLFRTPYGAHCKQLSTVLDGLGIKPIGWDIDPQDWRLRDAPKIEAYIEKHLIDAARPRHRAVPRRAGRHGRSRCRTSSTGSTRRTRARASRGAAADQDPQLRVSPAASVSWCRRSSTRSRGARDLANMPLALADPRCGPAEVPPLAWPPGQV